MASWRWLAILAQLMCYTATFSGGASTHPLTALCFFFVGLALLVDDITPTRAWLQRVAIAVVLLITGWRLIDLLFGAHGSDLITPFQSVVTQELRLGLRNSMGINSAIMFLCVAVSLVFYNANKLIVSQVMGFIAVAIPTLSFTGYAYSLENFYGQMSILTTTVGFCLSFAALAATAHTGGLKAVLSPYLGGKIARFQTLIGYVFPTALGFLIIKSLTSNEGSLFGLFVVTVCWFIILMVSMSAVYQERIDNERRKSERLLAQAAMNDPLTGLSNRRKFVDFLDAEKNRAKRNNTEFWLLLLDVDHFKKVNDTAGHDMGDRVLVEVARTLQQSVRAVDLVSRVGGEEFSVILADTNQQGAQRVAEHLRTAVENTDVPGWTDIHGPITVSLGAVSVTGLSVLDDTIKRADKALYRAKAHGRNRVEIAGPPLDRNESGDVMA